MGTSYVSRWSDNQENFVKTLGLRIRKQNAFVFPLTLSRWDVTQALCEHVFQGIIQNTPDKTHQNSGHWSAQSNTHSRAESTVNIMFTRKRRVHKAYVRWTSCFLAMVLTMQYTDKFTCTAFLRQQLQGDPNRRPVSLRPIISWRLRRMKWKMTHTWVGCELDDRPSFWSKFRLLPIIRSRTTGKNDPGGLYESPCIMLMELVPKKGPRC